MPEVLLLLLGTFELKRATPTCSFVPEPYADKAVIGFASGKRICVSELLPVPDSQKYFLVHLDEPVTQTVLRRLRDDGLEPIGYLAYQNVICRKEPGSRLPAASARRILPFRPEYKLAPEFTETAARPRAGQSLLVAALWPGEDARAVADQIAATGGSVLEAATSVVTAVADPRVVASLPGVAWVQEPGKTEPFNVNVQWVVQTGWRPSVPDPVHGRRVWEQGIRGQGMVIGLFDSGMNTDHRMFSDPTLRIAGPGIYPEHRKVVAYKLFRDAVFGDVGALGWHGSGVAGTLAGNDGPSGDSTLFDGVAPDARIYFLDVGSYSRFVLYDDVTEMLDSVRLGRGMLEPPRQVSGSFGSRDALGYYRLAEAALDAVCWQDKEFLVVWAAGNDGGDRYRLGHPSCAKNCLTVGATGNGVSSNRLFSASSRGPTRDGRIKPNIVAPGESVVTVWGADSVSYGMKSGTSYSAPAVSAGLCLVRQYLKEGRYPTGIPDPRRSIERPSAALLRALAVTGADSNVGTLPVPNKDVGWGRLNLSGILHFPDDSVNMAFVDESSGLGTAEYDEYEFMLERREPLRVTLAWTDTAAAPQASIALVNDLNLELISPDNNRYRGNQFLDGQSAANPTSWDERNVEEVCQLYYPLPGRWRARVYGRSVFTPRQPYALVVKSGGLTNSVVEEEHGDSGFPPVHFVRAGQVLPFGVPPGAVVALYAVDGRRCYVLRPGERLPVLGAGLYFSTVCVEGRQTSCGRLLVVR